MEVRVIKCDECGKECGSVYYTIYQNEGGFRTGKVTNKIDMCKDCFDSMYTNFNRRDAYGADEVNASGFEGYKQCCDNCGTGLQYCELDNRGRFRFCGNWTPKGVVG